MEWTDYEFIVPRGSERSTETSAELTGWETVIFEVEDDQERGET